jgi:hypothetical protein
MSDLDKLQCKYLVLKWKDIDISFGYSHDHRSQLNDLIERVEEYREDIGKPATNKYIVINTDEPYIQEIIDIMKKHGHWG